MLKKVISPRKKSSDGEKAERLAEQFLVSQGYVAIARNFHSRVGEVDLIMQHRSTYVFVEVRYRANATRGSASESITAAKYRRILKTAEYWLMKNNLQHSQYQIDVIAIDGLLDLHHIDWLQAV
ncbi:hypothetical protein MGA5115_02785 [Marinomonas gallaica]|uniref:UPF0102 protein MGA5115_02785 n=1 Tax=Marinomonas gallaica TaxID=1806667 RepID=A0A1C3JTS7_9GAMM|nr:YraN family protein [Marinomonas gallaica]SBT18638.1 hypothetical protein MGA5115_02785 [Marinomonas gallaica]SBT21593.1 hypothetical protein MGA5116_02189 [Marinomonas gallaica]